MPDSDRSSQRDDATHNQWAGGRYAEVRREAERSAEIRGGIAPGASVITEYGLLPHYDVAGGEVDIGRFLAGEPEPMVEYVLAPVPRAGRVLRLQADIYQPWQIAAATIRTAGSAVVELADGLRGRGVGLEIVVTAQLTAAATGSRYETGIVVQRPNEPFDVSRLAFAIAHPGMTRRLLFSIMEHEPWEARQEFGIRSGEGYGRVSPRRWRDTDFYVALTDAVLAEGWAQQQLDSCESGSGYLQPIR